MHEFNVNRVRPKKIISHFVAKNTGKLRKTCTACAACIKLFFERFAGVLRASAAVIALIFNISNAKSRGFRPKNCAILVQKERATREERAQKQRTCTAQRVTHACDFCAFYAGAGRVCCSKTASKFIETFANATENRESFPQISVQKALQSSGKPARPALHASTDCPNVLSSFCVRLRLRSRWSIRI